MENYNKRVPENMESGTKNKLAIYQSTDGALQLDVKLENETVWLNRNQMAQLFDRDVKTIGKHINNALKEELSSITTDQNSLESSIENPTVAKFATVQIEGSREVVREVEYYNIDVILSVGYRVKSKRGIEFRRWANKVLKEYIVKGVARNDRRLEQLGQVVKLLKRVHESVEAKELLNVIEKYNDALSLLDDYDHQTMPRPKGSKATYELTYEECRELIASMSFGAESDLFGNEKDDSFKGSIGNIYQTAFGEEVYPTLEEKAANLLYFVTKNHSFSDGNKRIAAALFLYFLDKNHALFTAEGEKRIADHTLVALTIMIAESRPAEKEMMVSIIMNAIAVK